MIIYVVDQNNEWVMNVATRSILKSVNIRDARSAKAFISCMENAQGKKSKPVIISKAYSQATESDMRAFLSRKE
jgi:hypothetical protein